MYGTYRIVFKDHKNIERTRETLANNFKQASNIFDSSYGINEIISLGLVDKNKIELTKDKLTEIVLTFYKDGVLSYDHKIYPTEKDLKESLEVRLKNK